MGPSILLVLAAVVLLAAWSGLLAWLAHVPRDLPLDWLGLWAGDRRDHPGLLLATEDWFQSTGRTGGDTSPGAAHPNPPLTQEADPAYQLARNDGIFLGRWIPPDSHRWTVSVWVRLAAGTNAPGFIPLAGGLDRGLNRPWCWGLTNGLAAFQLRHRDQKRLTVTPVKLQAGEWAQLTAVYALPQLRLYVNGEPAGDQSSAQLPSPGRGVWLGTPAGARAGRPMVAVDDFAVFNRALSAEEVSACHEAGRGAPLKFHDRRDRGAHLASHGTPWVLGVAAVLAGLAVLPWLRAHVFGGLGELASPPLRPVRWTLLGGAAGTCLLVGVLAQAGRRADELNFRLVTETFRQSTDSHLERVSDLITRLRDQAAASTNLTPAQFKAWLTALNFPHDHPGLYAVGLALRAEADEVGLLAQTWGAHYTNGFAVWPEVPDAERIRWRGWPAQPRLPVVVHVSRQDGSVSLGDRTQLGRDLAAVRVDEGEEEAGLQLVELQLAARRAGTVACGLVELSGAEFSGVPRPGTRLFTALRRPPPAGEGFSAPRDWAGVVFASVDWRAWLKSHWERQPPLVGLRLLAGANDTGFNHRAGLAADLGEIFPERARPERPYLEREVALPVYGRRVWAQFWTTPAFEAQSHRRWPGIMAWAGALFTLLTAGLLAVQIRGRLREAGIAAELRGALTALEAARRERERLSHDLHDGTIQSLYALQLGLSRASEQARFAQPALGARLAEYRQNLTAVIGELRGFILRHESDPGPLADLAGVLADLLGRLRGTTDTELRAELSADAARCLTGEQAVHLANLAREALSNALRHAHATRITVTLRGEPERVALEIADDGVGFNPSQPHKGLGLTSMTSRTRAAGGELHIESGAGEGTRVRVTVPQLAT